MALAYVDQSIGMIEKRETVPYEADLLSLIYEGWIVATRRGLKSALTFIQEVSHALSQDDLQVMIEILRTEAGPAMAKEMRDGLLGLFDRAYKNGKAIGLSTQIADVSFNLKDEVSVEWLVNNNSYWIGNYFDRHLSQSIANTVATGLEQGLGRDEVGNLLKGFFENYPGVGIKPQNYWSGLASSAMNRSRNFGLVRGYVEVGIAELQIMAMDDERTCPICGELDGKIIPVARAFSQVEQMIASETPDDVRSVAAWPSVDQIAGLDISEIMDKGVVLPPYHWLCRCTVVSYFKKSKVDLSRHFLRAA